jgi:hypothetical protein
MQPHPLAHKLRNWVLKASLQPRYDELSELEESLFMLLPSCSVSSLKTLTGPCCQRVVYSDTLNASAENRYLSTSLML